MAAQEVHCVVGELHLTVSRLASAEMSLGRIATQFGCQVVSTDPDLPGGVYNDHFYGDGDHQLTARDGLRVLAEELADAGADLRAHSTNAMRYPLWLSGMASRYQNDLRLVALLGMAPARLPATWMPIGRRLQAVEVARETLHGETHGGGPGLYLRETIAALQRFVAMTDQDVAVPDPADPLAPPRYEGPASEARQRLDSGLHLAHLRHDPAHKVVVVVGRSEISGGPVAASFSLLRPVERERTPPTHSRSASTDTPRPPDAAHHPGGWTPRPPSTGPRPEHTDPPPPAL